MNGLRSRLVHLYVPSKRCQLTLKFVNFSVSYVFVMFFLTGLNLTHRHSTRLERIAKDKHSIILRAFINCRHQKFYKIGPQEREIMTSLFKFDVHVDTSSTRKAVYWFKCLSTVTFMVRLYYKEFAKIR